MHAQLLAKPDGTGRRKATAAPSTGVEGESATGGTHEGGGDSGTEEHTWTEDTWKLEQAQLSGTCAKMVMACVRHRYSIYHYFINSLMLIRSIGRRTKTRTTGLLA